MSNTLQVRSALWVLLAAVGCLLLIGCLNLGILLLARASSREKELAVRAALGAGAGRLRRQMLAEVVPLSLAGAAGGIALAWLLLRVFAPLFPAQIPRIDSAGLNTTVLAFATGVSLLVVLIASLLPAGVAGRFRITAMQQDSRSVTGGTKARGILVIAQVTVTIVLLFAGALFARSLANVLRVNPGFSTDGVLSMHLTIARAKYPKDEQVSAYYDRIADRVRALPGVLAAGFVNRLPLSGIDQTGPVEFENELGKFVDTDWRSATPGYFEAAGIPLKRGRLFNSFDAPGSPPVAVIDEQLAREVFGAADPIGKRVRIPFADSPWTEIVGVAGHILNATPERERPAADLLAGIATNAGSSCIGSSNPGPSGVSLWSDYRRDPHGGPRSTGLRRSHDGGVDVPNAGDAQSDHLAGRVVWGSVTDSGVSRLVRGDFLLGRSADARVRDSNGARRERRAREAAGARPGGKTRAGRMHRWNRACGPRGQSSSKPAVRSDSIRCRGPSSRSRAADCRRFAGVRGSRAAGNKN